MQLGTENATSGEIGAQRVVDRRPVLGGVSWDGGGAESNEHDAQSRGELGKDDNDARTGLETTASCRRETDKPSRLFEKKRIWQEFSRGTGGNMTLSRVTDKGLEMSSRKKKSGKRHTETHTDISPEVLGLEDKVEEIFFHVEKTVVTTIRPNEDVKPCLRNDRKILEDLKSMKFVKKARRIFEEDKLQNNEEDKPARSTPQPKKRLWKKDPPASPMTPRGRPSGKKDQIRDPMISTRAHRVTKKKEERSTHSNLFSSEKTNDAGRGKKKDLLVKESLRLGLIKPFNKFGKKDQDFDDKLRNFQGRQVPLFEGASPPSNKIDFNLGQNYNPLERTGREPLVQKDTIGTQLGERHHLELCRPTTGLGQGTGLGAAWQQLGQGGLASLEKTSK